MLLGWIMQGLVENWITQRLQVGRIRQLHFSNVSSRKRSAYPWENQQDWRDLWKTLVRNASSRRRETDPWTSSWWCVSPGCIFSSMRWSGKHEIQGKGEPEDRRLEESGQNLTTAARGLKFELQSMEELLKVSNFHLCAGIKFLILKTAFWDSVKDFRGFNNLGLNSWEVYSPFSAVCLLTTIPALLPPAIWSVPPEDATWLISFLSIINVVDVDVFFFGVITILSVFCLNKIKQNAVCTKHITYQHCWSVTRENSIQFQCASLNGMWLQSGME